MKRVDALAGKWKKQLFFIILFICLGALILWAGHTFGTSSVRVSDDVSRVASVCGDLALSNKRIVCWERELVPVVKQYGMKAVLASVESLFIRSDDASEGGITKCHDVTHAIGRIGQEVGGDVTQTFSQCINICGYGCFMGVVDGYLASGKNVMEENTDEICNKTIHPLPCGHALGHVMANRTGELNPALKLCDTLQDPYLRQECTSGVFMELFDTANFVHATLQIPADLNRFCNSLWDSHKLFCFNNIGYFSYVRDGNAPASVQLCMNAPTEDDKKTCISMLAEHLYYVLKGSELDMKIFCDSLDESFHATCIESVLLKSVISDPIARHGFGLCGLYERDKRSRCFQALGAYIEGNERGKDKRETLCKKLASEDQISCLQ